MIYRDWPRKLPSDIELCAIQLPGRSNRLAEPSYTNILAIARAIAAEIVPLLDMPFAFFGHSMGAVIGFELARLLRAEGRPLPLHLFVSGRQAPQIPDDDPVTYNLPNHEFINELRRLNGTPKEALEHPELMELLSPIIRADFEAIQTYEYIPDKPLDCPITAFGGLQDRDVSRENLEAWRQQTTSSFLLRMLPGDHFFVNSARDVIITIVAQTLALEH